MALKMNVLKSSILNERQTISKNFLLALIGKSVDSKTVKFAIKLVTKFCWLCFDFECMDVVTGGSDCPINPQ